jgi:hypothetical protein
VISTHFCVLFFEIRKFDRDYISTNSRRRKRTSQRAASMD